MKGLLGTLGGRGAVVSGGSPRGGLLAVEGEGRPEGPEVPLRRDAAADIVRAVAGHLGSLRHEYNKALRMNPDLEGKVTVSLTVAPDGAVAECRVVDSTLNAPDLEKRLLERIRKWEFPSVSAEPVTVTYPFAFSPTM